MVLSALRLKRLREQRGLSQAEVAAALGIDRTTYVKYEAGGSVKRNIEKLSSFFGVSTDYLLGKSPDIKVYNEPNAPNLPENLSPVDTLVSDIFANDPEILALFQGNQIKETTATPNIASKKLSDLSKEEKRTIKNALILGLQAVGLIHDRA